MNEISSSKPFLEETSKTSKLVKMISKLSVCLLLSCLAVVTNGQRTEVHACRGRTTRFASVLSDCKDFWRCFHDPPTRGSCPDNTLFHDERQTCVLPRNQRCFECNRNTFYQLRSVHGACNQFSVCFNGQTSLHECQSGLWFDGRRGISNCNRRPANGQCYREENLTEQEQSIQCPNTQMPRPLFVRAQNSCNRFHVCTQPGQRSVPQQCPGDLHFNLQTAQCDLPERSNCEQNRTPAPARPCPPGRPNAFVPCRASCHHYWICAANGSTQRFDCAGDLIFDHINNVCQARSRGARCWLEDNINRPVDSSANAPAETDSFISEGADAQEEPSVEPAINVKSDISNDLL